ncbi:hypothetical protein chiPu_0025366, partial [Chiloscyllium punctatum]|nr:hypothetical protein [Chiloscyllium punctatum]
PHRRRRTVTCRPPAPRTAADAPSPAGRRHPAPPQTYRHLPATGTPHRRRHTVTCRPPAPRTAADIPSLAGYRHLPIAGTLPPAGTLRHHRDTATCRLLQSCRHPSAPGILRRRRDTIAPRQSQKRRRSINSAIWRVATDMDLLAALGHYPRTGISWNLWDRYIQNHKP